MKWFRRGVLTLILLLILIGGGGYLWLRGSLPQTDGTVVLPGLSAEVDIVRDRHGVPHITAINQTDAAYALGFAHAQDRLWQMEMNRRIGAGRMSELLGTATLGIDRFLRMLGLYRHAEASMQYLSANALAIYTAYAAGVNAFLDNRSGPCRRSF